MESWSQVVGMWCSSKRGEQPKNNWMFCWLLFLLSFDLINAIFLEFSMFIMMDTAREMGKLMFGDSVVSKKLLWLICSYWLQQSLRTVVLSRWLPSARALRAWSQTDSDCSICDKWCGAEWRRRWQHCPHGYPDRCSGDGTVGLGALSGGDVRMGRRKGSQQSTVSVDMFSRDLLWRQQRNGVVLGGVVVKRRALKVSYFNL